MSPFGFGVQGGISDEEYSKRLVDDLLNRLELPPEPVAPQPRQPPAKWRQILGAIGDAMSNYGATFGGQGRHPGIFATKLQQFMEQGQAEQERYRQEQQAYRGQRADIGNRIRIGQFEREQDLVGAKQLAEIKATNQQRQLAGRAAIGYLVTPEGERVMVNVVRDPSTGRLTGVEEVGPSPWAPSIMPGMVIGPDGQPRAGILNVPKRPRAPASLVPGPGGSRLEPQPPAGMIESLGGEAGVVEGIPAVMDVFNRAAASVGGSEGTLNQLQNWVQAQAAGTSLGPVAAPPELVNYYASVRSILFPYVKSISGAAFPEQELRRYESQFPIPGVDTPGIAQHKWNNLIQQMVRDIRAKYKAAGRTPAPIGTAAPSTSVDDLLRQYDEELNANPAP